MAFKRLRVDAFTWQGMPVVISVGRSRGYKVLIRPEEIEVTSASRLSRAAAIPILMRHGSWIQKNWAKFQLDKQKRGPEPKDPLAGQWQEGTTIFFFGQQVQLRCDASKESHQEGDTLWLCVEPWASEQEKNAVLFGVLCERLRDYIRVRLPQIAAHQTKQPQVVKLSNATRTWGVCTSRGTIRLSWRLAFLGPELIDYVIAHELAHLHYMDHSQAFWQHVERLCPQSQEKRARCLQYTMKALPLFAFSQEVGLKGSRQVVWEATIL